MLQKGEDDLQFLYQSIREKKNNNIIKEISIDKEHFTELSETDHAFCDYFNRLFNSNHLEISQEWLTIWNTIPSKVHDTLILLISDTKILEALHRINDDKTLGIYGFIAKTFKVNWDLISKQFILAIQYFFSTKKHPQTFKHTHITLIPKTKYANSIANFWPISLHTTFNKVIAKILAKGSNLASLLLLALFNLLLSIGETYQIIFPWLKKFVEKFTWEIMVKHFVQNLT